MSLRSEFLAVKNIPAELVNWVESLIERIEGSAPVEQVIEPEGNDDNQPDME